MQTINRDVFIFGHKVLFFPLFYACIPKLDFIEQVLALLETLLQCNEQNVIFVVEMRNCIIYNFAVCGGKKKQKVMYKSAKNAGKLGVNYYLTL